MVARERTRAERTIERWLDRTAAQYGLCAIEARGLLDEASAEDAIVDGLLRWPPDLRPAIERWPWLRPWIDTIYWLFGQEGGGPLDGPNEWIVCGIVLAGITLDIIPPIHHWY